MKKTLVINLRPAKRGTGPSAEMLDFVNARAYSIADGADPATAKPVEAYEFTLDGEAWVRRAVALQQKRCNVVAEVTLADTRPATVTDPATRVKRAKTDYGVACHTATVSIDAFLGVVEWRVSTATEAAVTDLDAALGL
jgi:hypothetical protein